MRTRFIGARTLAVTCQLVVVLISSVVIFVVWLAREVGALDDVFVEATEVGDADADEGHGLFDAGPDDQGNGVL